MFLGAFLCFIFKAHAQYQPIGTGQKTVAVSVNPIFPYIGNFFNATENNDLIISGGSIIYRNFSSGTRAFTAEGFVTARTRNSSINTYTTMALKEIDASIALGKEYRKQNNKWSFYAGWAIPLRVSDANREYNYSTEIVRLGESRTLENKDGLSLGSGLHGSLGVEYYMNDVLFVGAELRGAFGLGYRFEGKNVTERMQLDQQGNLESITTTQVLENGFYANISTIAPVVFRMGVRF